MHILISLFHPLRLEWLNIDISLSSYLFYHPLHLRIHAFSIRRRVVAHNTHLCRLYCAAFTCLLEFHENTTSSSSSNTTAYLPFKCNRQWICARVCIRALCKYISTLKKFIYIFNFIFILHHLCWSLLCLNTSMIIDPHGIGL